MIICQIYQPEQRRFGGLLKRVSQMDLLGQRSADNDGTLGYDYSLDYGYTLG